MSNMIPYVRLVENEVLLASNDMNILKNLFSFEETGIECTRIIPKTDMDFLFINRYGTVTHFNQSSQLIVAGVDYKKNATLPFILTTSEGFLKYMNIIDELNSLDEEIAKLIDKRHEAKKIRDSFIGA